MNTARTRQAFTLVELLIVIGIIAVLIAMLMPVLSKVREQGRQVVCLSNLRQVGTAMISYAADNDGYLPATARNAMDSNGQFTGAYPSQDWLFWQKDRIPNYGATEIEHSALARYLSLNFNGNGDALAANSQSLAVLRCPSDDIQVRNQISSSAGQYYFSYVMNWLIASDSSFISSGTVTYTGTAPALCLSLHRILNPSQKALMYEEDQVSINDGEGMPWTGCTGTFNSSSDPSSWGTIGAVNLLSMRHEMSKAATGGSASSITGQWSSAVPNPDARGNVFFSDGHGEFVMRSYLHRPDHAVGSQY